MQKGGASAETAKTRGGVNITNARRLGARFYESTRLPLLLADSDGRELWRRRGCALCARLPGLPKRESACRDYRRKAVEISFRWGEPYISVCPLGLVTFTVPLSREGLLAGGLFSGFCIFPQMEADMRQQLRTLIGPRSRPRLRVVPWDSLQQSAYLLCDLAEAHGMNDAAHVAGRRRAEVRQLTIANYREDAREGAADLVTSLVAMQNEIIDKVVLGDLAGSREIINRFLGLVLLESGTSFDMLKVRLLEIIIIISRAAMSKGISAEGLLGPRYSYLTEINASTGFDDLFWKVTRALENFTRAVSEERGRKARVHMTRMKEFLKESFMAKVSARQVAAAAGLSVSRALHLFRRECGMSLSAYIARQRVDYARYLLKNTERSMADIASECGFYDQSHFTKAFKALEGAPPLRYRMSARGVEASR